MRRKLSELNVIDDFMMNELATKEIAEYVNRVKKSPNVEEIYMTMGDKIDFLCRESEEIGEQRGIEIGKQKMLNIIIDAAKKAGVSEEMEKLVNDCSDISL